MQKINQIQDTTTVTTSLNCWSLTKSVAFTTCRIRTAVGSVSVQGTACDAQVVDRAAPGAGPVQTRSFNSRDDCQHQQEGRDHDDFVHVFFGVESIGSRRTTLMASKYWAGFFKGFFRDNVIDACTQHAAIIRDSGDRVQITRSIVLFQPCIQSLERKDSLCRGSCVIPLHGVSGFTSLDKLMTPG